MKHHHHHSHKHACPPEEDSHTILRFENNAEMDLTKTVNVEMPLVGNHIQEHLRMKKYHAQVQGYCDTIKESLMKT